MYNWFLAHLEGVFERTILLKATVVQTADCNGCCCTCPELSALHLYYQSYCLVNCRRLVLTLWDSPHVLQINQNKQIFQLQLQPGFVQKHSNVPSAGVARNVSFATSHKQAWSNHHFKPPSKCNGLKNPPKQKRKWQIIYQNQQKKNFQKLQPNSVTTTKKKHTQKPPPP